jgi:hypothetical protein
MRQRDYEDQPEAPDLGEVVQEDTAETLVGPPDSDVLDAGYVPPDRPYLVEDEAAATRSEDLDQRLRRERPDVAADDESEPDRAGRLEATETTPDTRNTEPGMAEDAGLSGGAATAEEAAMHVRDENDIQREADRYRDEPE